MRQPFVALGTAALFTIGAHAAAVCASSAEMKALQAAVLEQQLAAAAQSCHATEDYARFVDTYRGAIVKADQTVRAFFRRQSAGESYEAYKSRIAHDIAMKSLHDPKFCGAAKTVFDLALGRGKPSEPPTLVGTGYEGCRPLPEKPVIAAKPRPAIAAAVKPTTPAKTSTAPAAWDADHIMALLRPIDVPIPTPAPPHAVRALALAHPAPRPLRPTVALKPRLANTQLPKPVIAPHRAVVADIGVPPVAAMRVVHPEVSHPAARHAEAEWGKDADGNVPNAYLPGAQWIGAEADAPSRGRFDEAPSYMYRGPDGRWYVRIGRHDRWNDDEDE